MGIVILSLLETPTKIIFPDSIAGWVGLGLYCLLFVICLTHWWDVPLTMLQRRWQLLVFLFVSIVPANLFIGFGGNSLEDPSFLQGQVTGMVLSAIPMFLVSAFFGPVLGGLVGFLGGLIQALLSTNSPFTPFILGISGVLLGVCLRQRYRGGVYAAVRRPIGAAFVNIVITYMLSSGAAFFDAEGPLAGMIDAGLSNWRSDLFFCVLPMALTGILAELLQNQHVGPWRKPSYMLPSPDEGFAEGKFWRISLPVTFLFIFFFTQVSWSIQTGQINEMLQSSISSHAGLAANYWLLEMDELVEKGNVVATPVVLQQSSMDFYVLMQKTFDKAKTRVSVINAKAQVIHQFPDNSMASEFTPDIVAAVKMILSGDEGRLISKHSTNSPLWMTIDLINPIKNSDGKTVGAMIIQQGDLPRPVDSSFWSEITRIEEAGGEVWVVPADGKTSMLDNIPAPDVESQVFPGEFLVHRGWNTTAAYAYWPASPDWNIFVRIPTTAAGANILLNFGRQILLLVFGFVFLLFLLDMYWVNLFKDEQKLLQATKQISRGEYSPVLGLQDVIELTDLAQAVEQIRVNVKAQMDEARRLISIGRGVAVREDFGTAVEPILRAALRGDASSARVILVPPQVESVIQSPMRRYGLGERSNAYAVLDNQVLEICQREGIFVIRNTARSRRIDFNSAVTVPASLVCLPVYLEKDDFLGVFWIGYEKQQVFPEEEIALLKTLASEIAVAAAGERRLSETELGRKQFEALVTSIQDPLLLLDMSGEVIFANDAALSLEGLITRDEDGNRFASLPSLQDSVPGIYTEVASEGLVREIQLPNGRSYSARFTPFQSEGKFGGSLCLLRDVNSYTELLSRKGEFVETVSHDLRQPLTMISGYATMIQMVGDINDQQRSYLQKITNGLETMNRMVNNILDLGRIEAGTRLKLEKVDAGKMIAQVVEEFSPQAFQKKIKLSNTTAPGVSPTIDADSELLHQAVFNIVENAIKFTGIDGKVNVWVETTPDACVFGIQDTGIGISPIDLPGLFDRNNRGSVRETGQRASKLGLSIVKSIVELHRGEVLVESQLGKGSTFRIEIPI